MIDQNNQQGKSTKSGGLLPPIHDTTEDYRLSSIFGSADLSKLPTEFAVSQPLEIKNQDVIPNSDVCVGAATAAVLEDHEGVPLSMEYQFSRAKRVNGDPEAFGATLKDGCVSATEYGALETTAFPWRLETSGRDYFAYWENIPDYIDILAKKHIQLSYFSAETGPYDRFDNLRSALWDNKNGKSSILTGAKWRPEWTRAPQGKIPKEYGDFGFAHAFKAYAWECLKEKSNDDVLLLQLSNGTDVGDRGIFRIPRPVVNREFLYGNYCFKDILKEYAEFHGKYGIKSTDTYARKFFAVLRSLFRR